MSEYNWPPAGCCGLWHLNGDANDASSHGNHGTNAGGVGWGLGRFGKCGVFDGSSTDYISIPQNSTLQPPDFTVSLWFKGPGSTSANAGLFCNYCIYIQSDVYYYGFRVILSSTGLPFIDLHNGYAKGVTSLFGTKIINDNIWHWIVVTRDDNYMKIYIDGLPNASVVSPIQQKYSGAAAPAVSIGGYQTFEAYARDFKYFPTGKIDEVTFLDHAISEKNVRDLWAFRNGWI